MLPFLIFHIFGWFQRPFYLFVSARGEVFPMVVKFSITLDGWRPPNGSLSTSPLIFQRSRLSDRRQVV